MESAINDVCVRLTSWMPFPALAGQGDDPWMSRALIAMMLLAPLCSTIGVQVVNFRLAFFAEAVGHSAYTGIGLGIAVISLLGLSGLSPEVVMVLFGIGVGLAITFYRRGTSLSEDTIIGVFSATIIALGLCLIHLFADRIKNFSLVTFLQGNPLMITAWEVAGLAAFFALAMGYQLLTYNRLLFLGINAPLAKTLGFWVTAYEYSFAALLAVVVMFSIKAVGSLLVTALLVIPAASARNLALSAGGLFWWGAVISSTSNLLGLYLSDRFGLGTNSTPVLVAAGWFVFSAAYAFVRQRQTT